MTLIYDRGFSDKTIIGKHDKIVKKTIIDKLSATDAFINTTWLRQDKELNKILYKKQPKRIICYSGADWESTFCKKEIHELINAHENVIHIGNTYGNHYFSFWMDFVYSNQLGYLNFDTWKIEDNIKPYMCLNRKPHGHRIQLVREIFNKDLQDLGILSLGSPSTRLTLKERKYLPLPILLDTDIINEQGDNSVYENAQGITNDITSLGHPDNWNSHFLNVVTETTVHTNVFVSEKVFKPILGMRPFVILGDNNVYKVLKEWGFDTFDDLFGTGYEDINVLGRTIWVRDVIENVCKEKNLKELLVKLKPRLEENKKLFKDVAIKNRYKIHNLEL
jgi:hypothetical protein